MAIKNVTNLLKLNADKRRQKKKKQDSDFLKNPPEQAARMKPNLMRELEEGPMYWAARKQTSDENFKTSYG